MNDSTLERADIDRGAVHRLFAMLEEMTWGADGSVALLVETPEPHRHVVRKQVDVVPGKGFAGDHVEKSHYRGEHVPGREVSAVTLEVLDVLGVDPAAVGDNLVTTGVDLAHLKAGDLVQVGDVILERSHRTHRPCETFRKRSNPEAFDVVKRGGYRGALFVVKKGGRVTTGDRIRVVDGGRQGRESEA